MLKWESTENSHIITLKQGKAIIKEKQQETKIIYLPHVEDNQGNIVASFEPGFEDFETADVFVQANLIELDRIGKDETEFQRGLASTLDYCITLLVEPNRVFHRRRIASIKSWLTKEPTNYDTDNLPQNDWVNYIFDWHTANNLYQVDVPPHGKASIGEETSNPQSSFMFGGESKFRVQIEDSTGVILVDTHYPSPLDFNTAETRLREVLTELENPFVDEVYLDYLSFTLRICGYLLPLDTSLMQYIRLDYIETYLGEVLP